MKKTILLAVASVAAMSVSSFAGSQPQPPPVEAAPVVIFAATPEKPYTLTSVAAANYTDIRVTNNATCVMKFGGRLLNVTNFDAQRVHGAMNNPLAETTVTLMPGQTELAKRLFPSNTSIPVSFDYSFDFILQKHQQEFDVTNDVAGKRAHPMPPESEWSKLPNSMDVAARGELEPFAWYMTPSGRPAQSLRYKTTTNEALGLRSEVSKLAERDEAIRNGQSVVAVIQKQSRETLRAFQANALNSVVVREKDANGNMIERPATPAEQTAQMRRKRPLSQAEKDEMAAAHERGG
ncbi:MAG: hypothetical protein QOK24_2733 [Verrucomicrobiota bacterium]|jgi:hypothetical protein